jgi:hypothetical protein
MNNKIAIGDYRNKSEAFKGINLFNGGIEDMLTMHKKANWCFVLNNHIIKE